MHMTYSNVWRVPRFSYELAKMTWSFPNKFAMIRMEYQCKIVEVGNDRFKGE